MEELMLTKKKKDDFATLFKSYIKHSIAYNRGKTKISDSDFELLEGKIEKEFKTNIDEKGRLTIPFRRKVRRALAESGIELSLAGEANAVFRAIKLHINKKEFLQSLEKVNHEFLIDGLDKLRTEEDFVDWVKSQPTERVLGYSQISAHWLIEPKYDGISLTAYYNESILEKVVTRGDGWMGIDVTELVEGHIIPKNIRTQKVSAVRGELLMTLDSFKDFSATSVTQYKTPRDATIAILSMKNPLYIAKYLTFVPYFSIERGRPTKKLYDLKAMGFKEQEIIITSITDLKKKITSLMENRTTYRKIFRNIDYPLDGIVITLDYTGAKPIAFKKLSSGFCHSVVVESAIWRVSDKKNQLSCTLTYTPIEEEGKTYNKVVIREDDFKLFTTNKIMIGSHINVRIVSGVAELHGFPQDPIEGCRTRINVPVCCPRCSHFFSGKYACENEFCNLGVMSQIQRFDTAIKNKRHPDEIEELIDKEGIANLYEYIRYRQQESDEFDKKIKEAKLTCILKSFNLMGMGEKHYETLATEMEILEYTTDLKKWRDHIHKEGKHNIAVFELKKKIAPFYRYLEYNINWVDAFFRFLKIIRED